MSERDDSDGRRSIGARGRGLLGGLTRGGDAIHDVAMMTVIHVRRFAAIATSTVSRVDTEIRETIWDVKDAAVDRLHASPVDVALPRETGHVRLRRDEIGPRPGN